MSGCFRMTARAALALTIGAFVALGVFVSWRCDRSPCTIHSPGAGEACITVRIIGPCAMVSSGAMAIVVASGTVTALALLTMPAIRRRVSLRRRFREGVQ